MKRDLSVITDKVRNRIQAWLEGVDPTSCPFPVVFNRCHICRSIFPQLPAVMVFQNREVKPPCPCDYYDETYVIRVAKEIIQS